MRKSYIAESDVGYDGRWAGPDGDVIIEVKRTSNARDVRGSLLALAFELDRESPSTQALLVLTESRLSAGRLAEELLRFQSIVKDEIGLKIHLATFENERLKGMPGPGFSEELALFVRDLVLHETATQGGRVSRVFVQSLVVDRWLQGRPMDSSLEVLEEVKASRQTIIAALEHLKKLKVLAGNFGDFTINPPSLEAWLDLAQDLRVERKSMWFVDPSGLSRTPKELLSRLVKIKDRPGSKLDVGVSGAMAAHHFYEALDLTAPPRLDLSVYNGDVSFVRQLDAGLVEVKNLRAHAPLVLHLGRRLRPASTRKSPGLDTASPLECLADLVDLDLKVEARDFAYHLNRIAPSSQPKP